MMEMMEKLKIYKKCRVSNSERTAILPKKKKQ